MDPPPETQPRQVQRRSRNACDACRARKVKVRERRNFVVDFHRIDQISNFETSFSVCMMETEDAKLALSSQFRVLGIDPGRREVHQTGM